MKTQLEERIATGLPDPRATAKSIHRKAGQLAKVIRCEPQQFWQELGKSKRNPNGDGRIAAFEVPELNLVAVLQTPNGGTR